MRTFMNVGLGCSGCVALLGIALSLTLIAIHVGLPLVVVGAIGLVAFGIGRLAVNARETGPGR